MKAKLEKLFQNEREKNKEKLREIILAMKVREQKANLKIMILKNKPN